MTSYTGAKAPKRIKKNIYQWIGIRGGIISAVVICTTALVFLGKNASAGTDENSAPQAVSDETGVDSDSGNQTPTPAKKKTPPRFLKNVDRFMKNKVEPKIKHALGEPVTNEHPVEGGVSEGSTPKIDTATRVDKQAQKVNTKNLSSKTKTTGKQLLKTVTNAVSTVSKIPIVGDQLNSLLPDEVQQALQIIVEINEWKQLIQAGYQEEPVREAKKCTIQVEQTNIQGEPVFDKEGNVILQDYQAEDVRELRNISDDLYRDKTREILSSDKGKKLIGAQKDTLPETKGQRLNNWCTEYSGASARQLGRELMALVALKGGVWREPQEGRTIVNAVAIRGRDFDKGLCNNDRKNYDDTLFLVKDTTKNTSSTSLIREYRITTESSNPMDGVGKLASKQFVYLEGLHKAQYPAYRMKGGSGEGTRNGQSGKAAISGANLHSSMRLDGNAVNSDFPLPQNMSLGCQVVACSQTQFEADVISFVKPAVEFPYTIAESSEAQMIVDGCSEKNTTSMLLGRKM